ncbi:hypothetical protein NDU88_005129 [Pleurodeles waltl]|uniref:Retrotransposon gag domain-containing protein n=1 Tax=Pleurodeles waltl TaxID=8319 RepID=A0AAV7WUC1_PLEWA|nr:hypothetical protein NDU88_005129 [Pleurodeles waltl]
MFERPGLEAAAEEALCDIQQENQDVLNYITRFKQQAAKTTWVVTLFRRGLQDEIKDELVHSTQVESLKELMDLALNIEYHLREHEETKDQGAVPVRSISPLGMSP